MRGRFSFLKAGYLDELAIAKSRNPYYNDYPPGVANERIELPVLCGLLDFSLYVFAIYPLVVMNQAFFFLWMLTIPFAFLSAIMPVGPISAMYWKWHRTPTPVKKNESLEQLADSLRARRQWLQGLAAESVKVETELLQEVEKSGDLRFAFEAQINQARDTRKMISAEITKIDSQLSSIDVVL